MKKIIGLLVCLGLLFCVNAHALKLPGKLSALGRGESESSSGGVSIGDLVNTKTQAIETYRAARQALEVSYEKAAEAFGVKEEVMTVLAEMRTLNEGTINSKNMDKYSKKSENVNNIIAEGMAGTMEPSVESKKLLVESMISLVDGIIKEKNLIAEVKTLVENAKATLQTAPMMEKMKVKGVVGTALALSKGIPGDVKLTTGILGTYVNYSKSHKITVPKEATNLLGGE